VKLDKTAAVECGLQSWLVKNVKTWIAQNVDSVGQLVLSQEK